MYKKEVGEIEVKELNLKEISSKLFPWMLGKTYLKEDTKYLIICNFGATMLFDKEGLISEGRN